MPAAGDEHGKLIVDGVTYPVTVQSLPTVVESYKTYDDINLVKTADIGQVSLVRAACCAAEYTATRELTPISVWQNPPRHTVSTTTTSSPLISSATQPDCALLQVLVVGLPTSDHEPTTQSEDGITPVMQKASDVFKPELEPQGIDPALIAKVEQDILDILAGKAPYGVTYTDSEEVYHIDKSGKGQWRSA
jgi:hypothetical protein